jgi:hypothetical protein
MGQARYVGCSRCTWEPQERLQQHQLACCRCRSGCAALLRPVQQVPSMWRLRQTWRVTYCQSVQCCVDRCLHLMRPHVLHPLEAAWHRWPGGCPVWPALRCSANRVTDLHACRYRWLPHRQLPVTPACSSSSCDRRSAVHAGCACIGSCLSHQW